MRLGLLIAAGATGAVLTVPAGSDAVATLTPVADTYVSAGRPAGNFGKAGNLMVGGRPVSIAYLRFRVPLPSGQRVTRATLQLSATSKPGARFTVHRVASTTWGETTTSYANAPPVQAPLAASSGAHPGPSRVSVDVTRLVAHGGLVSLAVKGTTPIVFRSRESAAGGPRLVVETSGAAVVSTTTTTAGGGGGPCGTATGPPRSVDHVIWIWMENKAYDDVIGSSSAPYENRLAAACGLATNFHGVAHPSLPNYIAATSGSTQGITDDDAPSAHPLDVASIFSQVRAVGKTWRDYAESSPGPCTLAAGGQYVPRHDPAVYYTGIRGDCAAWDVPMGTTSAGSFLSDLSNGTLPAFAFVTPNLCNSTHDCSVGTGDAWLAAWFDKILSSPAYLAGTTVVFVVWDEDDGSGTNHVPLIVVSPTTPAGTQAGTSFDHYSLLRTTEQLLGIGAFLGQAGDAASMVSAFRLG